MDCVLFRQQVTPVFSEAARVIHDRTGRMRTSKVVPWKRLFTCAAGGAFVGTVGLVLVLWSHFAGEACISSSATTGIWSASVLVAAVRQDRSPEPLGPKSGQRDASPVQRSESK